MMRRLFLSLCLLSTCVAVLPVTTVHASSAPDVVNGAGNTERRVIGTSIKGRAIIAKRYGRGNTVVLAVGSIHGNEQSGIAIAQKIAASKIPKGYTLWVIETVNPDGTRANTRGNARGVDLNRNFSAFWGPIVCPSKNCSGPVANSEPETRALSSFLRDIQPRLTVFYHSEGNVIDAARTEVANRDTIEAYHDATGIPVETVPCGTAPRCTGNATQFINTQIAGASSFIVELRCDRRCLSSKDIKMHTAAFWAATRA